MKYVLPTKDAIAQLTNPSAGFMLAVQMGMVPGFTTEVKYGENPSIDTGSAPEDIWEQGGVYTFSLTSNIDTLSSSNTGDVGQLIKVFGIYDPLTSTKEDEGYAVLNGQNKVLIYDNIDLTGNPVTFWRAYRMENEGGGSGNLAGMLYCYIDGDITAGVPDVATTIRAVIDNGNNKTLMAVYTTPPKKVAFLYRGEFGISRAQSTGIVQATYFSRQYEQLFKVQKRASVTNSGSSIYQDERSFPDIIPALTDIVLRVESVSANSTGVFGTFDMLLVDESIFPPEYLVAIEQPNPTA
jgi:hypothetical protein